MKLLRIRNVWLAIATIVVFLLGNSLVTLLSTFELVQNQQALIHSYENRGSVKATLAALLEAETGERGYIITGNPLYLASYNSALVRAGNHIMRLQSRTGDNLEQRARIVRLKQLINKKLGLMEKTIATRRESFIDAQKLVASDEGKFVMDEIAELIGQMSIEQAELLKQRELDSQASLNRAVVSLAVVTVMGIGLVIGIGGLLHYDLEARRQASETLLASEEQARKLALVASRTQNAVVITDAGGDIEWINDSFSRTTGYALADVQHRYLADVLLGPGSDNAAIEQLRQHLRRGASVVVEMICYRKSGERYWNLIELQPVRDSHDRIVNFIAIELDITHRKAVEEDIQRYATELESANQTLEQYCRLADSANRAKSEFLANMSHEIRTPMTAILGYAELIQSEGIEPGQRINCAQGIQRNGTHLLQLINDVLDLTKIEAGKLQTETLACSPCQIVWDVASMMAARATTNHLSFDVEFPGPIPESIQSDPTRLRQILVNLIGNALKFTTDGGVRVCCQLVDLDNSPMLRFEVIDTGIGMQPEQIERLFLPFEQGDSSTSRQFGGSGLGLAISKRLAEALGGRIEVTSTPGTGSTFTLWIDPGDLTGVSMVEDPHVPVSVLEDTDLTAADRPDLSGMKILLAEDGEDNQYLISLHLREAGAEVDVAGTGLVAVAKAVRSVARNQPYDLILMDMQMPELDGYAATRLLRYQHYDRPIVALTAHAMSGDRQECLAAGCNEYLSKPVARAKLLRIVASYRRSAGQPAETDGYQASCRDTLPLEDVLRSTVSQEPGMREAIAPFLKRLLGRCEAIRKALQKGDFSVIGAQAHQIKGSAGGFGFPSISAAAQEVELALHQDSGPQALESAVDRLVQLCERARAPEQTAPQGIGV